MTPSQQCTVKQLEAKGYEFDREQDGYAYLKLFYRGEYETELISRVEVAPDGDWSEVTGRSSPAASG